MSLRVALVLGLVSTWFLVERTQVGGVSSCQCAREAGSPAKIGWHLGSLAYSQAQGPVSAPGNIGGLWLQRNTSDSFTGRTKEELVLSGEMLDEVAGRASPELRLSCNSFVSKKGERFSNLDISFYPVTEIGPPTKVVCWGHSGGDYHGGWGENVGPTSGCPYQDRLYTFSLWMNEDGKISQLENTARGTAQGGSTLVGFSLAWIDGKDKKQAGRQRPAVAALLTAKRLLVRFAGADGRNHTAQFLPSGLERGHVAGMCSGLSW